MKREHTTGRRTRLQCVYSKGTPLLQRVDYMSDGTPVPIYREVNKPGRIHRPKAAMLINRGNDYDAIRAERERIIARAVAKRPGLGLLRQMGSAIADRIIYRTKHRIGAGLTR